jgi:HTH-type transcriptional regulator / antitoxin HigA
MLVTNEITQMAKAIVTQLPILNGISNSDEHQQALILLEDLLEHYDENLIIIEALSSVIARYEDKAAEFDDFNKRQNDIYAATEN